MIFIIIFIISIGMQLTAAFLALLLIRTTGKKLAWISISVAMLLMATRRTVSFMILLSKNKEITFDIPEIIALVISLLMLIGVLLIGKYFRAIHSTEEALQKSRNEFKRISQEFDALLNAIPDNLTLQSPDLKILWANRSTTIRLGKDTSKIIGQHCYKLWHNRSAPCEKSCPVQRSFQTGDKENATVYTPDERILDLRTAPIKDENGRVISVIEVARDITDHRRLEEQLRQAQKMEAVGQLAGGVAHDFNNILTTIIGYSNLIQVKIKEDESLKTYVEHILASADRAANLTQSLLAFSRKQIISPKPVRANEIVQRVERLLSRVLGKDIELRVTLTDTENTVMADAGQIEQVLMNLATNARDAMPDGGVLIMETGISEIDKGFIKEHGFGEHRKYVLITVTDTGGEMDKQTRSRIFEPFYTTKEVGKGTGLGLSMAYGIIKQHNGFINVYSEADRGTTFKIYLPLIKTEAEKTISSEAVVPLKGGSETILIAEDDASVRKLTRDILQKYGYTVIPAEDGEDALKKFMENRDKIHLLLFDVIMPKKNGKEVYEEIKKIKPDMKALFLSGYTANLIHKKGILDEGLNFILKPVSMNDLLRKVREVLDKNS